ncbi:hypothetical protein LNP74_27880 [Klebsiella pneumoniae subsp. pneumoniae]|nr:hypothetical protein [Klebsiella pneumoniae subsp. pneumoniae]
MGRKFHFASRLLPEREGGDVRGSKEDVYPRDYYPLPQRRMPAEHYFAPLSATILQRIRSLHSGFADHPHNRFDILLVTGFPTARHAARQRGEQTKGRSTTKHCCYLSGRSLRSSCSSSWIVAVHAPQPHDDLPFLSGALGLFRFGLTAAIGVVSLPRAGRSIARAGGRITVASGDLHDWALITSTTSANRYPSLLSYEATRGGVYQVAGSANADAG